MPDRRSTSLIGDRHAWLMTNMPDWRPRHASSETHRRPKCPIGDQYVSGEKSETDMPAEFNRNSNTFI